jgi:hypothetical protein
MNAAALVKSLWPGLKKILTAIGRWVITRVRKVGAQKVAMWMLKRAEGYQTNRLKAAKARKDKLATRFRTNQISRWKRAAKWILEHAVDLSEAAALALERLAREADIPVTGPYR